MIKSLRKPLLKKGVWYWRFISLVISEALTVPWKAGSERETLSNAHSASRSLRVFYLQLDHVLVGGGGYGLRRGKDIIGIPYDFHIVQLSRRRRQFLTPGTGSERRFGHAFRIFATVHRRAGLFQKSRHFLFLACSPLFCFVRFRSLFSLFFSNSIRMERFNLLCSRCC